MRIEASNVIGLDAELFARVGDTTKVVDLRRNNINQLPIGIFKGMTALEVRVGVAYGK